MARVLYLNVKNARDRKLALMRLKKAGLNGAYTDAGAFSKAKRGTDVYAVARKKRLSGFRVKKTKMAYI